MADRVRELLDKDQEKRWAEFVEEYHTTTRVEPRIVPEYKAKQHLSQELALERKRLIQIVEGMGKYYNHQGVMIRSDCTGEWIKEADLQKEIGEV